MTESRTGPKFRHPTFNCNISCSSFTQRTSPCLNHSQEPCEWVDVDLGVLWVESEQIGTYLLHLKVGCPNFVPFWGSAICPMWPNLKQGQNSNSQLLWSILSAVMLPIEPQDRHQPIHRDPMNGVVMMWFLWLKLKQTLHLFIYLFI